MTDLFAPSAEELANATRPPLADQLRPSSIEDVVGQEHLTGPGRPLHQMVKSGKLSSIIFWGPPGVGKTTLSRLLAGLVDMRFVAISAVTTNVAEIKKVFAEAAAMRQTGRRTLLMVDEIHRLNKGVQDLFLPYMEDGTIVLVGSTTEHPSYEINNAILSRSSVLILRGLSDEALETLLTRAEALQRNPLPLTADARAELRARAQGDGRRLLNDAEILLPVETSEPLDIDAMAALLGRNLPKHDKSRDYHYDLVSAFQKSIRGSDPDAALYWFAKMLEGGEDMKFILRRLTIMASEEVAIADPQALQQVVAARQAYEFLGSPEGEYAVAQAIVYIATAPKSNATYLAYHAARDLARATPGTYPPINIINHPTARLARERGYIYDHDVEGAFSGQNHWPDEVSSDDRKLYRPNPRGFEAQIAKRLDHWNALRR